MYSPSPHNVTYCLGSFVAHGWQEPNKEFTRLGLCSPRPECVAEKVKRNIGIVTFPVVFFTVDDFGFIWVQFQPTFLKPLRNCIPYTNSL